MSGQTAVEEWLDALEGTRLPGWDPERSIYRCDYCSGNIHPLKHGRYNEDRRVTHYVTDRIIEPNEGIVKPGELSILRSYCSDCNRNTFQYPCQGFSEILLSSYLRPDGTYTDWEIKEFSGVNDGEPWNPKEYYNTISDAIDMPMKFEDWLAMGKIGAAIEGSREGGGPSLISHGPEDVIDHFLILDIDPREILDEDGDATLPEVTEEELQDRVEDRAEEMEHTVDDEDAFHEQLASER